MHDDEDTPPAPCFSWLQYIKYYTLLLIHTIRVPVDIYYSSENVYNNSIGAELAISISISWAITISIVYCVYN